MPDHPCPACGEPMHAATWGPFQLVSPTPIDLTRLDASDADAWGAVGLSVDVPALGNDFDRVRRHIRAFMACTEGLTGEMWDMSADSLAVRIVEAREPQVIPLWRDIPIEEE